MNDDDDDEQEDSTTIVTTAAAKKPSKRKMTMPEKTCAKNNRIDCTVCEKKISTKTFINHKQICRGVACTHCLKKYATNMMLNRHLKICKKNVK